MGSKPPVPVPRRCYKRPISPEQIDQLGATDMQGLYRNITGLNMTEGQRTGQNRYTVRGVSVGGIYTSLSVRELDVVLDVGLAPRSFAGAREPGPRVQPHASQRRLRRRRSLGDSRRSPLRRRTAPRGPP